jgi:hypothetical protein
MPSLLTLEKIDHDMELEWLLCLASRFQTYQRLRPTEIGGMQRSKEFPTSTTSSSLGENPRGPQFWTESIAFGQKVSQPRNGPAGNSSNPMRPGPKTAACQTGPSHTHKPG